VKIFKKFYLIWVFLIGLNTYGMDHVKDFYKPVFASIAVLYGSYFGSKQISCQAHITRSGSNKFYPNFYQSYYDSRQSVDLSTQITHQPIDAKTVKYTINLMWINSKRDNKRAHIFPLSEVGGYCYYTNKYDKNRASYLINLINWAKLNPKSNVILWFDSQMETAQAINRTEIVLKETSPLPGQIELKDVRQFTLVKDYPEVFGEEMPIYFRVDLLRSILLEELIFRHKDTCAVYSDFDCSPLDKAELFDKTTVEKLNKHHFVLADLGSRVNGPENGFQMILYDLRLSKAMQKHLVSRNIAHGYRLLTELGREPSIKMRDLKRKAAQEAVYLSYVNMFSDLGHAVPTKKVDMPLSQIENYKEQLK